VEDPTTIALNLTFFGTLGVAFLMFIGLCISVMLTLVIAGLGRLVALIVMALFGRLPKNETIEIVRLAADGSPLPAEAEVVPAKAKAKKAPRPRAGPRAPRTDRLEETADPRRPSGGAPQRRRPPSPGDCRPAGAARPREGLGRRRSCRRRPRSGACAGRHAGSQGHRAGPAPARRRRGQRDRGGSARGVGPAPRCRAGRTCHQQGRNGPVRVGAVRPAATACAETGRSRTCHGPGHRFHDVARAAPGRPHPRLTALVPCRRAPATGRSRGRQRDKPPVSLTLSNHVR
jgi:hypothetical protein